MRVAAFSALVLLSSASLAAADQAPGSWRTWLVDGPAALAPPPPPDAAETRAELGRLKDLAGRRDEAARATIAYWDSGSPSYRWNELALQETLRRGVSTPFVGRHMALLHAAISDAIVATWAAKDRYNRPRPSAADADVKAIVAVPASPSYPGEHAAAAGAAAEVLAYLFPDRAAEFRRRAEEAAQSRVLAGVQYPSDSAAGLALGRKAGALAVERGKADRSDSKWSGTVPTEPGKWNGTNPILPLGGTWRTWVLSRSDELRPPAPPAPDSAQIKADLAEIRAVKRTPAVASAAWFWEHGAGGMRGAFHWIDQIGRKDVEYRLDPPQAARAYAVTSIAFHDAVVACWEAKYAYWAPRPFMLDAELKPLFAAPNHPSYPAAHGCLSTAAATALARLFPHHAASFEAMGDEAAEARIWAGIHFRSDVEAGKKLGRAVAEKVLAAVVRDGVR